MVMTLVVRGNNVLLPETQQPEPATIVVNVSSGKITQVIKGVSDDVPTGAQVVDAGDLIVMPGLVDAHVHLNEPGRTAWEGFETGTKAAASGGVTTLIDMPLNSLPPTTTVANLEAKRNASKGQIHVDVGFWGGIIPDNEEHLVPLIHAGVRGFKCFLIDSGVDEFPAVSKEEVRRAAAILQDYDTVFMFHAEMEEEAVVPNPTTASLDYSSFLASRPEQLEQSAISFIASVQKDHPKLRTHIVHLSAASCLSTIKEARISLPLSVETCFHYLSINAESVPNGATQHKCCPPIREESNRQALWDGLDNGDIEFVVSDHSPCIAEMKKFTEGDFSTAWGGISTLGLGLSVFYTHAKSRKGFNYGKMVKWLSSAPAKHASLQGTKGAIQVGADGDFVIWDPKASFTVDIADIHFKNKVSPYLGHTLQGVVHKTLLRGQVIYDRDAATLFSPPRGQTV